MDYNPSILSTSLLFSYDIMFILTKIGWDKSRFTVVPLKNNIITNNNTRINSMSHTTVNLLLPNCILNHVDLFYVVGVLELLVGLYCNPFQSQLIYKGGPQKPWNYLLAGGPLVVQASPAK